MKQGRKYYIDYLILAVLLLVSFIFSLGTGSSEVGFTKVFEILKGEQVNTAYEMVLFNIRLPKSITAVLSGFSLSLCGLMMQTLFRNPLAGPYVLGINSGASLFVGFILTGATFFGIDRDSIIYSLSVPLFATTGAVLTLIIILAASWRIRNNVTLLLTGIMLGFIYGALQSVMEYFANSADLKNFVIWSMGSIGNVTWDQLKIFAPVCLTGTIFSFLLIKPLNLLLLGDNYARSSGLNIRPAKWMIIILTGILSGITVAYCGPIAFIGLAVPHLCRILFKTNDHAVLIPACALLGASTLLLCDAAGRLFSNEIVLPLNVTTALFGAPLMIWLLFKNKNFSS